ncbi:MAG: hypothetical protein KC910_13490 [Candidatus Eremiobacteraeota bacterium]|nr:hypothetical protein [Candidatus Eremiobacteraeota bacterium]
MTRRGVWITEVVLAFGLMAVAILGLLAVFMSGLRLSSQARDVAAASELARLTLEQVKANLRTGGFAYVPAGTYRYDGALPDTPVGTAPLLFPPAPYPGTTVNGQAFTVVVSGSEMSSTLKDVQVEVSWGPTSKITLETRIHP